MERRMTHQLNAHATLVVSAIGLRLTPRWKRVLGADDRRRESKCNRHEINEHYFGIYIHQSSFSILSSGFGLLLLGQSPVAFGAFSKLCSASSIEKLPGFWLGLYTEIEHPDKA